MPKIRYVLFLPLVITILLFTQGAHIAQAQTPTPTEAPTPTSDNSGAINALQDKIEDYQRKINDLQSQEKTLSSQIGIMNNQISLTQLKIQAAKVQLAQMEKDIEVTKKRTKDLEKNIAASTKALIGRIGATYQVGRIDPWQVFLTSNNITNFLTRLTYLRLVQANDKKNIYAAQQNKANYESEKAVLEEKQQAEEVVKKELEGYTTQLNQDKAAKQALLDQTHGSEATYQSLLAQAQAQLAAFSGFVRSQGGLNIINADPSWPSDYFSQRDSRWARLAIGDSNISIGEAGCLLTSVAMTLTHRGNSTTPQIIGTNSSYFFDGNFRWSGLTSLGFNSPIRTTNKSSIDDSLSQGKWVIVGIDYSPNTGGQPFHFVVIISKNGGDYNLYDPWKGPNQSFNSAYGGDYITEVITY